MHIQTLIPILTVSVLIEELTFTHFPQIIFVEVIAGVAFLAKPLKPVLAYIVVVLTAVVMLRLLSWCGMTVGASATAWTMAIRGVFRTDRHSRSESSKTVGSEERRETEVVCRIWRNIAVLCMIEVDGWCRAVRRNRRHAGGLGDEQLHGLWL